MNHRYTNDPSIALSRSVATVTYAYRVVGILRDDKQRRNRSHRKSNCKSSSFLESHGWSSESNSSQCKLRLQEINSLVSFVTFYFSFRLSYLFFYFTWQLIGFRLGYSFSSERSERATRTRVSQTNSLAYRDIEMFAPTRGAESFNQIVHLNNITGYQYFYTCSSSSTYSSAAIRPK